MVSKSSSEIPQAREATTESACTGGVTRLQRHDAKHPGLQGIPALPASQHYQQIPAGNLT